MELSLRLLFVVAPGTGTLSSGNEDVQCWRDSGLLGKSSRRMIVLGLQNDEEGDGSRSRSPFCGPRAPCHISAAARVIIIKKCDSEINWRVPMALSRGMNAPPVKGWLARAGAAGIQNGVRNRIAQKPVRQNDGPSALQWWTWPGSARGK